MKISDLKTIIKEEFDFTGSDLDGTTAREIDIIIDMGHELLAHQEGKFDFDKLKEKLIELAQQSSIPYTEWFAEKIEEFRDDPTPNSSSNSLFEFLTDPDGIYTSLGYEDGKFTDEQLNAASEYYESRRRELF